MRVVLFALLLVLLIPGKSFCQNSYDMYISNSGNDKNPGTNSQSPRQTLTGTDSLLKKFAVTNGIVNVGLKSGDIFNDGITTTYPIELSTYFDASHKTDFAILNGTDEFDTGWAKQVGTSNTYKQSIGYSGFPGQAIGNYSYLFIIEIDKELEKTSPVAARKPLLLAPSLAALDTIPGSFYEPVSLDNPLPVYIHTTNGNSPNSNSKYRYEVTVRYSAIYGYTNNNNRFENLWVRGYGAGYGLIPGGNNTYCNNIIFGPGAATHYIVLKNGIVNHSLFLPASLNANLYAVVFYDTYGSGKQNLLTNSLFLDIAYPAYSHTSNPSNYASCKLDSILAFAGNGIGAVFFGTSNNDTVALNNVYVDNYYNAYNSNDCKFFSISNCYFKNVIFGVRYSALPAKSFINNVFIKASSIGITMQSNNALQISNSIIHMYTPSPVTLGVDFIANYGDTSNHINATGNIFISEANSTGTVIMASVNTNKGIGTSQDKWNNNVYILLKGSKMSWGITNRATNGGSTILTTLSEWQRQSGQDKNSLFFDLSNDPRGLKAIFIDPDNGDYELANTAEGNQIRALHAGMTNPITCFLQKPTYDDAANMIINNKLLTINSCRNPCLQNNIRVNYKFNPATLNNQQIKLQWVVGEQQNIDHYEVEKTLEDSNFTSIHSSAVTSDSVYSFIDNDIQLNLTYKYRLVIIAKNGDKCYSPIDSVKTISNKYKLAVYPNPSTGKIKVSVNGYTGPANIVITNAIGQTILVKESALENGVSESLDLSNQSKGIYSLKLQTVDGLYVERFIID